MGFFLALFLLLIFNFTSLWFVNTVCRFFGIYWGFLCGHCVWKEQMCQRSLSKIQTWPHHFLSDSVYGPQVKDLLPQPVILPPASSLAKPWVMSLWYNTFTDMGLIPLKVNFRKKGLSCSKQSKVWHCKGPNRYSLSELENGLSSEGGVTLRQEGHPVGGGHSLINSNPYSLLASPEPSLPHETSGYGTLYVNFSALSLFPTSACPPLWITSQVLPPMPSSSFAFYSQLHRPNQDPPQDESMPSFSSEAPDVGMGDCGKDQSSLHIYCFNLSWNLTCAFSSGNLLTLFKSPRISPAPLFSRMTVG